MVPVPLGPVTWVDATSELEQAFISFFDLPSLSLSSSAFAMPTYLLTRVGNCLTADPVHSLARIPLLAVHVSHLGHSEHPDVSSPESK